jgi:hypothetical protein
MSETKFRTHTEPVKPLPTTLNKLPRDKNYTSVKTNMTQPRHIQEVSDNTNANYRTQITYPGTLWLGGWMGPRDGLDDVKSFLLTLPGL